MQSTRLVAAVAELGSLAASRALDIKSEKKIKRAVYIALVAPLALVFWRYRVSGRIERGEPQVFLSDGAVAANPAIASRLQSTRPAGRVAELGSLVVT